MRAFLFSLIVSLLFSAVPQLNAQVENHEGINFQGVARNAQGAPVSSKKIKIKAGILSASDSLAYEEIHEVTTDPFGLFSVSIGEGKVELGDFSKLYWSGSFAYKLLISIDPSGGNNYTLAGTSVLKSVPYAKYADKAGNAFWERGTQSSISYFGSVGVNCSQDKVLLATAGTPTTQSIFGLTGAGVSLQQNWPGIGFNHYFKDGQKSISKGYGGYIGVDPVNGGMFFRTIPNAAAADQAAILEERMYISPKGLIGIGGTAPTATLDVNRGTGKDGTAIFRGTKNVSHFNFSTSEDTYIRGGKDGAVVSINDGNIGNVYLVSGGGKVGIGMEAPQATLDVFKGTNIASGYFRGTTYPSRFCYSTNEDTYIRGGKDKSNVYVNDLNIGNVYLVSGGGKVGIGTETPEGTVDVAKGTNYSSGIFRGSINASVFNYSATEDTYIRGGKDGAKVYINDQNIGGVVIAKDGGNVNIGTDESDGILPYSKFRLTGPTDKFAMYVTSSTASEGFPTAVIKNTGGGVGGQITSLGAGSIGLKVFGSRAIDAFGDVYIGGNIEYTGSFTHSSDIRYKNNIKPLSSSLSKVLKLNGVNYYYRVEEFASKNFNKSLQIGFIAQEVKAVVPEIVSEDKGGYLSVDYSKVTPLLVEAMKEQQAIIESLKSENAAVNKKLAELEAKLEKLSSIVDAEALAK